MASTLTQADLDKLSVEERLRLMELLWASLEDAPAPQWHRDVVRERLERMRKHPHPGVPAKEALDQLGKLGR